MSLVERVGEIVVSEYELKRIVSKLANQIRKDYQAIISRENPLLIVIILKGAFIFGADLLRELNDLPIQVDFLAIRSYEPGTTESSRVVQILKDLNTNIDGRLVLILEDIIDTGWSLDYIMRMLNARNPADLNVCVLLNKQQQREIKVPLDYVGINIPNKYVVGYGLDGDKMELHRNRRDVAVLKS